MSSKAILDNIIIVNNPSLFTDRINIQVTFSVTEPLSEPLQWNITYVGSAMSEDYDQVLEEFEVGPVDENSTLQFNIECDAPDAQKIPKNELLCVTALLLTSSYKNQEFIRIGYYVHNELTEEIEDLENIASSEIVSKIKRTIISDKPRVTNFNINWDEGSPKMSAKKVNFPEQSQSRLDDYYPFLKKQQGEEEINGDRQSVEKDRTSKEESQQIMICQ